MDISGFNRVLLHSMLFLLLLLTQYKTKAHDDVTHKVEKRLDSDVCFGESYVDPVLEKN